MKFMNMFFIVIFVVGMLLCICILLIPIPIPKEPVLVATKDGCNVYRYYDKGNKIYFNTCGGIK